MRFHVAEVVKTFDTPPTLDENLDDFRYRLLQGACQMKSPQLTMETSVRSPLITFTNGLVDDHSDSSATSCGDSDTADAAIDRANSIGCVWHGIRFREAVNHSPNTRKELMNATIVQAAVAKTAEDSAANAEADMQRRLQRIDRFSEWLDSAIRIPGIGYHIGWDTIIGLLPGVGDVVTTAMSAWIIKEARQLGVSKFTLARMIANTSIDALIGSVPVAGDLFDAAFKANVKNLRLLRQSLKKRGLLVDEGSPAVRVVDSATVAERKG